MSKRCSDIAVVGMACRFPGADDYRQFWRNLEQGVDSIREIPPGRWDIDDFYSPDINVPNKSISKWCGLLDGVDRFDNRFFNISPREAINMDPQQRLLLEETWHCIEDSGITLNKLQQKKTSVYVGVMTGDYRQEWASGNETDSYACLGNVESILANRISYTFNLKGSSICINAACASSLVTLHQAKCSLVTGECDYAIAGGVNLNLHPWKYISFSKARMLSPDGRCKTFDRDANGYVPGDGVGVLLLQKLDDAVSEGNHVYGIIKGSAVNHCGKSLSITAPRVESQRDVILEAYSEAGFSPETATYVEAHGTGTSLGDPMEIEALTRAFRKYTNKNQYCKIGSVKTNIGHLEASAGVAGIIKVLLMMQYKKVPPTLNIKVPNPTINFKVTPFDIAAGLTDWKTGRDDVPLRAGVSCFGFGGVNSHVLLEEYPVQKSKKRHAKDPSNPFVLSAKSAESLNDIIRDWNLFTGSKEFQEHGIEDMCLTLLAGREHFSFRYGVMVSNKEELIKALQEDFIIAKVEEEKKKRCLRLGEFLPPGIGEVKRLNSIFPAFKKSLDLILDKMPHQYDTSDLAGFWGALSPGEESFWFTYALAVTCIDLGFNPELVAGGSTGIWASLAVSGIIDPGDVPLVIKGELPVDKIKLSRPAIPFFDPVNKTIIWPHSIDGDYVDNVKRHISSIDDETALAYVTKARNLFNSQFTFKKYLGEWDKPLHDYGLNIKTLLFDERILNDRSEHEKKLVLMVAIWSSLRKLNLRWNLTDSWLDGSRWLNEIMNLLHDEVMSKEVAVKLLLDNNTDPKDVAVILNSRQHRLDPQKTYLHFKNHNIDLHELNDFKTWMETACSMGCEFSETEKEQFFFLNIGRLESQDYREVCIEMGRDVGLERTFKEALLQLWLKGINVRWDRLYSGISYRKVSLPVYSFSGETHRMRRDFCGSAFQRRHPLIHSNDSTLNEQRYSLRLSGNEFYLSDHIVGNLKTLPGAASLEMALASGVMAKEKKVSKIKNIAWARPVTLTSGGQEVVRDVFIGLYAGEDAVDYRIWTLAKDGTRVTHAQGKIIYEDSGVDCPFEFIDIEAVRKRCPDNIKRMKCYGLLKKLGFDYGPSFRTVQEFFSGATEGLSRLELPAQQKGACQEFLLHPSLLDGVFQTAVLHSARSGNQGPYLPFSLGEVHIREPLPETCYACVMEKKIKSGPGGGKNFDLYIADGSGRVLVKMLDFIMRESGGTFSRREQGNDYLLHIFQKLARGDLDEEDAAKKLGGWRHEN